MLHSGEVADGLDEPGVPPVLAHRGQRDPFADREAHPKASTSSDMVQARRARRRVAMRQTLAIMALLGLLAAVAPLNAYAAWSGGTGRGGGRTPSGLRPGWGQNSSTHRSSSG